MTVIYYPVLTTAGEAKIAAAVSANKKIDLVIMAIGDANGVYVAPNKSTSVLVRERYRGAIQFLEEDPNRPNRFVAEHVIPADIGGWTPREAILICADGTVFAHASLPPQPKTLLSDGGAGEMRILFYFDVATGQGAAVNIIVDPNILMASRQWVNSQFLTISKLAGGKKNAHLTKKSDAEQDYHWLDVSGISAAKERATHIFEFWRNRYFLHEQFGREPKQITDLLKVVRPGAANYQSPTGLAAALPNMPRIDWDPKTGDCNGLLTEPTRERLTTYPDNLIFSNNSGWQSVSQLVLTTAPGVAATSRKTITKKTATVAWVNAVWEVWGTESALVTFSMDNGNEANAGKVTFNLLTGAVGVPVDSGTFSGTIVDVREIDGHWRIRMQCTTDALAVARMSISVAAPVGGTVNVRRQWAEWGGYISSAITESPATNATRVGDAALVTMPFEMTPYGTLFLWARVVNADATSFSVAISNSQNDYIGLQYIASSSNYSGATFVVVGGASYSSAGAAIPSKGQWVKIAVSWRPGRLVTYHNGVKLDHVAGASFPGFNRALQYQLMFGGNSDGGRIHGAINIKEFWISAVETSEEILHLMAAY